MAKRSKIEIGRAVRRVQKEALLPVRELADEVGCSSRSLTRWIVEGQRGHYCDGLHRPGVGWMSSREAVARHLEVVEGVQPAAAAATGGAA